MRHAAALPYLDEHAVVIAASRTVTWAALLGMVEGIGSTWFVRSLGAADAAPSGPRPLGVGSTVPGFRVVVADEWAELALAGRHRYSDYLLAFRLEEASDGRTRLAAVSRAAFPGPAGALYRMLVIGTRLHVLATRRMLAVVKRRAEAG